MKYIFIFSNTKKAVPRSCSTAREGPQKMTCILGNTVTSTRIYWPALLNVSQVVCIRTWL